MFEKTMSKVFSSRNKAARHKTRRIIIKLRLKKNVCDIDFNGILVDSRSLGEFGIDTDHDRYYIHRMDPPNQILELLMDIEGLEGTVQIGKHHIRIHKGSVFKWKKILPNVIAALKDCDVQGSKKTIVVIKRPCRIPRIIIN